ncbi:MAG: hypothetical protein JRJ62_12390 [Deltaproteobacteria bacterium]|nr:hypothetical protein [Deltaproteobacteria bacterium]
MQLGNNGLTAPLSACALTDCPAMALSWACNWAICAAISVVWAVGAWFAAAVGCAVPLTNP